MKKILVDTISYAVLLLLLPTAVYLLFHGSPFVQVFMIVYQALVFTGAVVLILDRIDKLAANEDRKEQRP